MSHITHKCPKCHLPKTLTFHLYSHPLSRPQVIPKCASPLRYSLPSKSHLLLRSLKYRFLSTPSRSYTSVSQPIKDIQVTASIKDQKLTETPPYPLHPPRPPPGTERLLKIYKSSLPSPSLPRCHLFHYLFPPTPSLSSQDTPQKKSVEERPAFIDGLTGRRVTKKQVQKQALQLANGLRQLGVRKGEIAAVYGTNSLEWVNATLGCLAAGVIVSPISHAFTAHELAHQLTDSLASLIFIQPSLLPTLYEALPLLANPIPTDRIILLAPLPTTSYAMTHLTDPSTPPTYKYISQLWSTPLEISPLSPTEELSTAFLCYSSGTTGHPKGVETSHHNLTSQLQALQVAYEPLDPSHDVILGFLPLAHIYGLTCLLLHPLSIGVPVVLLPKYDERVLLRSIKEFSCTWCLVVPPVLASLISPHLLHPSHPLYPLRGVLSGAAPLSAELAKKFHAKFGITVTQGYGLTETSPVTHVMTAEEGREKLGKIGKLLPTYEARVVATGVVTHEGLDVLQGDEGELWLRGPSVMRGYWKDDKATRGTFGIGGWYKTGDVVKMDKEGYFEVVDRVKELIKYKGLQVPPAQLESLLLLHPDIIDVGIIPIYSPTRASEIPRAYVVPKPAMEAKIVAEVKKWSEGIQSWIKSYVSPSRYLRGGVGVVEKIPRTASGKILRKELRKWAEEEEKERDKWDKGEYGRRKFEKRKWKGKRSNYSL
ncbi:hypothetical protein TREMEDRAFT_42508 [Tremella mesenterica DSM 1558]|uniref:uncharacterized protein n=1 Tax=Tremella mesenterica (strain ATCC 24925 / CBS 8224 / DSM 1558 / NBRC 9311 / NRRL Y-6157 / RJB 2259-6 / UBC 559-6) TaxID=578456 RepID=UPI0003F49EF3|nr:uncharacterized protein TREMEDRAFT_42508 [Tremella mesenterica DSM 1558]EIW70964.1 hypothetical protein TREMEDRAFT_42508 [Tremella mesenterica DSM 1558]